MVRVLGIDEAGRGPAIGPMTVSGVIVEEGKEATLGEVKDSKFLSHKKRIKLAEHLQANFEYKTVVVEAPEIDEALLSETLNLNWLEAYKQAEIINALKPDVAIIDAPSTNPTAFTLYLKKLLDNPDIKIIMEHKADANYPVCSAASIIAKVAREDEMDKIKEKYGNTGPGYPAHPATQAFVEEHGKEFPEIIRRTWSTYAKYHGKITKDSQTTL